MLTPDYPAMEADPTCFLLFVGVIRVGQSTLQLRVLPHL